MLRRAVPTALGEIIVKIELPQRLRAGEQIKGAITLRNPFADPGYLACAVSTVWNDHRFVDFSKAFDVPPDGRLTFSFPTEFRSRIPDGAPDPVMPSKDALLIIYGLAINVRTKERRREDATFTITLHLEWWEQILFGIPVWGWLLGSGGAIALTGGVWYMMERRREFERMLLARRR